MSILDGTGLKVKLLEWGMDCINDEHYGNSDLFSPYIVRGSDVCWRFTSNGRRSWIYGLESSFTSLDETKAAAQADYEQRILSALTRG